MPSFRAATILASILFLLILGGCSSGAGNADPTVSSNNASSGNSGSSLNHNAEELGMVIKLPAEPEETAWKIQSPTKEARNGIAVGSAAKMLTAVLRFTDEDAARITAMAGAHGPPENVRLGIEDWYPAELVAQGESTGESVLNGRSFAANDFYSPPYSNGRVTHIENTNYFVLELYSN